MCIIYTSADLWYVSKVCQLLHQMAVEEKIKRKAANRKRKGQSREKPNVAGMEEPLSCKTITLVWQCLLLLGDKNEQATCFITTGGNINRK